MLKCQNCDIEFSESAKQTGRQKYCGKRCREKFWRKNHPEMDKVYNTRCRLKKIRYCINCFKAIPNERRISNPHSFHCSEECIKEHNKQHQRKYAKRASKLYYEYKTKLGCSYCGYNKYGGSLDFHHTNPNEKEFRISSKHWLSQSPLLLKELNKCILLCKNCHHEEHERMREAAKNNSERQS